MGCEVCFKGKARAGNVAQGSSPCLVFVMPASVPQHHGFKKTKVWCHRPVVPATQKAKAGGLLEPRNSKPAWAIEQDFISEGEKK